MPSMGKRWSGSGESPKTPCHGCAYKDSEGYCGKYRNWCYLVMYDRRVCERKVTG